jgi:hypothetical protein
MSDPEYLIIHPDDKGALERLFLRNHMPVVQVKGNDEDRFCVYVGLPIVEHRWHERRVASLVTCGTVRQFRLEAP